MPKSSLAQEPRVTLPGSEKAPLGPAAAPTASRTRITVTVLLKPRQPLAANPRTGPLRVSRAVYQRQHTADPATLRALKAFAAEFTLTLEPPAPGHRSIRLTGTVADMQRAFAVTLSDTAFEGHTYRTREGGIQLPSSIAPLVDAVLGLDNRSQAQAHFRIAKPRATNTSYTPVQVAQAYNFPATASGAGQTIGLIELGGGYRTADLTAYFKTLGRSAPKVTAVKVDGGKNAPSTPDGADGEVMLDIEVAAAVAPGAKIAVYFAPNTDQGFIDAISTAVHDKTNNPSVISISWGGPESTWTAQARTALDAACQSAAALGITITVAAGDNGSSDGVKGGGNNVDFPASSSHVLACGGTKLVVADARISAETVWNETAANEGATGGGVSTVFPLPAWQARANVPKPGASTGGRGVPDVSGDADPATGYIIRVDGQTSVIGGTSAVAPLWAGLIAVANQQLGAQAGFINPAIYAAKTGFHDIMQGNNGAFSAAPGWDACTGLGSPNAAALIPLLAPAKATKPKLTRKTP